MAKVDNVHSSALQIISTNNLSSFFMKLLLLIISKLLG